MTNFPDRNLNQTAVYWGNPITNGRGGFTWDDPVEIVCRWSDSGKMLESADGKQFVAISEVQVNQDLDVDGMLLLLSLDDLDSGNYDDPVNAGAISIKQFDKIPTIKANRFYRKAYL
jgi:hypothetical protein